MARRFELFTLSGLDLQGVVALVARLSPRERWFLVIAGIVLGGALLYLLLIEPLWQASVYRYARVAAKEQELRDIVALRRSYQSLQQDVAKSGQESRLRVSPVAVLEGLVTSTLGRNKVEAIKPVGQTLRTGQVREMIEMSLHSISLRELVDLLYKIDTVKPPLRTVRLSIKKRYADTHLFDVVLTTVALNGQ
jgi:type II secretory pathway component PulM